MKKTIICILFLGLSVDAFAKRQLKTRVSLGPVLARSFPVPGGGEFDFGFALNSQMMVELATSPYFAASFNPNPMEPVGEFISSVPATDMFGKIVPQCIVDRKPIEIDGQVVSFELEGSNSIKLGYQKGPDSHSGFGASIDYKVKKWSLWVNLFAAQPLFNGYKDLKAASQGEYKSKETNTNLEVNFKGFTVSPEFYHKSKLSSVTAGAARKALENIASILQSKNESGEFLWTTTVTRSADDLLLIGAGAAEGVKAGDIFEIQNMRHEWAGKPCQSKYDGISMGTAAMVQVYSVGNNSSLVQVLKGQYYNDVFVGDRVIISELID